MQTAAETVAPPLPLLLLLLSAGGVCLASDVLETRTEGGGWPIPLISFGLVADPHANVKHRQPWWCDLACWKKEVKLAHSKKGRKHDTVMIKLQESVDVLSRVPGLSFSVNLGDLCDMDMMVNMPPVLDIWRALPHKKHNLMGNHDLRAENDRFGETARLRNKTQIRWLLGQWALNDTFFYSFSYPPFRFLVLDSMTLPPTAKSGALKDKQVAWLEGQLEDAKKRDEDVVVFAHIPIGLASNALRHLLLRFDNILAFFHGHKHSGGYAWHDTGKHMITIQGMIETNTNAFAYVNVFVDRIEVVGFGRVPSRVYFKTDAQTHRATARRMESYAHLYEAYKPYPSHYNATVLSHLTDPASLLVPASRLLPRPFGNPADKTQKQLRPLDSQASVEKLRKLPVQRPPGTGKQAANAQGSDLPKEEAGAVRAAPTAHPPPPAADERTAQTVAKKSVRVSTEPAIDSVDDIVSPQNMAVSIFVFSLSLAVLLLWLKRIGIRKIMRRW
ncbi:Manganese-dependent ADP-ribose/CDP-alcohol diphosphatase [Diplonema papillatum]|nr:Manganese-dependent ADP-ribose/CDP-alcohol diphosphatase [Diplonema papillatum]